MTPIRPNGVIGTAPPRVDGVAKVTGEARYGADHALDQVAHAAVALATIARGRIVAIDQSGLKGIPGVLAVLTHANVGRAVGGGRWFLRGGPMGTVKAPLASPEVHFAGQIAALIVADTFEAARDAAAALRFHYEEEFASASLDSPGATPAKPSALGETALKKGDVDAELARAAVTIDAVYQTPAQHQNPLELFQATCAWDGDQLTVWESTQNVRGVQHGLAKQLGLKAANIRVRSPLIGGAFGARGDLGQVTALVALAAKRTGRPVKFVGSRRQGFTMRSFRAETRHHLRYGADAQGRLVAVDHESWELGARGEIMAMCGSETTARLYASASIRTKVNGVSADRQTPGFMRAPPEVPYLFAAESALDELAHQLAIDPVELRRRNETSEDPIDGRPYTSRGLLRCFGEGAAAFGWDATRPAPGSRRDGRWLVGQGCAAAIYPAQIGPGEARLTLSPTGQLTVEVGAHEIGTGVTTVVAQTAADRLGLRTEEVEVRLGDSALPSAVLSAGSSGTATVCNVVAIAGDRLAQRLIKAAVAPTGALGGADPAQVRFVEGRLVAGNRSVALAELAGAGLSEHAVFDPKGGIPLIGPALVRRGMPIITGAARNRDALRFAFGAQFVEVRVDADTGEIRVPRMVGAFAAGRIINPRTARSQLLGGMIWGIGAALLEATEVDERTGRYVNPDLAEYHLAVNADVGEIEALLLEEEDDRLNPLGIKGVGELGITGVNAAIANAVFNATGKRVRRLPIRPEDVV